MICLFAVITTMMSCNSTKKNAASAEKPSKEIDNIITDKYWKLVMLEGQKVTMVDGQEKEASFTLNSKNNTITGFSGCNNFNGTFELNDGNRIRIGTLATTMRACDGVTNEHSLLKVFDQADNYTIVNDELRLNIGRRAPLAVFKAVYMK